MNKYTKLIIGVVCATVMSTSVFAADMLSQAKPVTVNQWVMTLEGAGITETSGGAETAFGLNIGLGLTGELLFPVEGGIRQGLAFSSPEGNKTILTTKLYADWTVLQVKKLDVFVGANAGLTYGNTAPIWVAGPEGGLRLWVKEDVAVIGRIEYPFDLNNNKAFNNLNYVVGFQVKF